MIRTDLLLILASFLDTLPPERWNFRHIVGTDWQGLPDLSCGTTACAFGWASTIPEIQAAGMRMIKRRLGYAWELSPGNTTTIGTEVGQQVFGLSEEDWDYLFQYRLDDEYDEDDQIRYQACLPKDATAKDVANRIREFCNDV